MVISVEKVLEEITASRYSCYRSLCYEMLLLELCISSEPGDLFRTTYHRLRHIDLAGPVAEILSVHILQGRSMRVTRRSNPYLISTDYGRVSRGAPGSLCPRVIGIYLFKS